MGEFKNESTYKAFVNGGREGEFDGLFDKAVADINSGLLGGEFPMMIGGEKRFSSGKIIEKSPIDGRIIGTFQEGRRTDASDAIASAETAFADWSSKDYKTRVGLFRKAASIFSRDKFRIAAAMSIENGKTRYESIGEVDEAIDFLNYYSEEMERNKGYSRRTGIAGTGIRVNAGFQGSPGSSERVKIRLRPYGVFGIIAPFNFPVSISVGMSSGALITGNSVVFKPSSTDNMAMLTGFMIYKVFEEAGLPKGVFNYITGPGSEVGDELVTDKRVSGIAFTGSRKTGLSMISKAISLGQQKVFVVEMGGKNPVIVTESANLDAAVQGVLGAAFGYSGQKCSACSRVYVSRKVRDEFVRRLAERATSLGIGNPLLKENYVGPLISEKAVEKYKSAVEQAGARGKIICGGHVAPGKGSSLYVEPTIAELRHDDPLMHEELFVPFLSIAAYDMFETALKQANDVEYGLTAGLYSNRRSEISRFASGIEAGVVYINRETSATTGAMVGVHTFVGWKGSGLTGKGTGSRHYLQQFMREQSVSEVKGS